jgi:hypothetical protein
MHPLMLNSTSHIAIQPPLASSMQVVHDTRRYKGASRWLLGCIRNKVDLKAEALEITAHLLAHCVTSSPKVDDSCT